MAWPTQWTRVEEDFIRDNLSRSDRELAELINQKLGPTKMKTEISVKRKRQEMGLRKKQGVKLGTIRGSYVRPAGITMTAMEVENYDGT